MEATMIWALNIGRKYKERRDKHDYMSDFAS